MAQLGITSWPSGARPSHKSEIGVDRASEHRGCLSDISRTMQLGLGAMKTGKMQSIACSCYTVLVAWVMEEFQRLLSQQSTSNKHFDSVSPKSRARCSKSQSRLELDSSSVLWTIELIVLHNPQTSWSPATYPFDTAKRHTTSLQDNTYSNPYFSMADKNILPIPDMDQPEGHSSTSRPKLYILDYGAGNVRRCVIRRHLLCTR